MARRGEPNFWVHQPRVIIPRAAALVKVRRTREALQSIERIRQLVGLRGLRYQTQRALEQGAVMQAAHERWAMAARTKCLRHWRCCNECVGDGGAAVAGAVRMFMMKPGWNTWVRQTREGAHHLTALASSRVHLRQAMFAQWFLMAAMVMEQRRLAQQAAGIGNQLQLDDKFSRWRDKAASKYVCRKLAHKVQVGRERRVLFTCLSHWQEGVDLANQQKLVLVYGSNWHRMKLLARCLKHWRVAIGKTSPI
eukprot:TRINITY_DN37155_c0_g1_i1.p1 TRINITY_DN37155_c0_g1~~TRINITY_DN37155_c0_g1_i1.p1  ORF type:complete len:251 (+),score=33.72 TRINITY_DN37155_c0_g1_i1:211-963(+)